MISATPSAPFSPEEIASVGLKPEEYEEIVRRLGRHPNKAEGWLWDSILKASRSPSPKSTTPAFSPGPTRMRSPVVGNCLSSGLEFL